MDNHVTGTRHKTMTNKNTEKIKVDQRSLLGVNPSVHGGYTIPLSHKTPTNYSSSIAVAFL